MIRLSDEGIVELAKLYTELAVQNNLINRRETSEETAKEVAMFFNTLIGELSAN